MRARGAIAPLAAWVMLASCQEVAAPSPAPLSLTMSAKVSLYNRTHEMHRLEVLSLRQDLVFDCDRLELAPEAVLGADAFVWPDRPASVELFPGQEVSVDPTHWTTRAVDTAPCGAVRIMGEGIPDVIAWWGVGDQVRTITVDVEVPKELLPAGPSLVLEATYDEEPRIWRGVVCPDHAWPAACSSDEREDAARRPEGATYSWASAGELRHVPFDETRRRVRRRDDEAMIRMAATPATHAYDEVREDAGGCLEFWNDGGTADVHVCGVPELFRDLEPDSGAEGTLTISRTTDFGWVGSVVTFDAQRVVGGEFRRSRIVLANVSGDRVSRQAMRWTAEAIDGASTLESTCGQRFEQIALEVEWGSDFVAEMVAGEQAQVGAKRMHLLRAERGLTRSLVCDPWRGYDPRESVLVEYATREEL